MLSRANKMKQLEVAVCLQRVAYIVSFARLLADKTNIKTQKKRQTQLARDPEHLQNRPI